MSRQKACKTDGEQRVPGIMILLFLLVLMPGVSVSQQYFVKTYAAENGLSTRLVTDACQDHAGYMWFSTYQGVSKYDGFSFTNYDTVSGLSDQHYRKIRCDEKGIIWVIPELNIGKIVFFKNNQWQTLEKPSSKKPVYYTTSFNIFYQDNSPVICVGSYNGADVYRNGKWTHIDISDKKTDNIVYTVAVNNKSFYLGTNSGLYVLNGNLPDHSLDKKVNAGKEPILAVMFEKQGQAGEKMWVLTNHSIGYYKDNSLTPIAGGFFLEDVDVALFPFISMGKGGEVIFGSNLSKYLLEISDRKIIPLGIKNGFSSNGASSLFVDREWNIWFADSRGIDKISNINVVNYTESGGLPEKEVTAIVEYGDGRYILGHNNRISILQNQQIKVIEFPGLQSNLTRVLDMMKDRDGNIWFTANTLGIGKLKPGGAIQWYAVEAGCRSTSVVQDKSGRIWIGTNRRLFYLKGEKVVPYEHNNMINSSARKLFASDKGGIFITNINGLWYVEKDKAIKIKSVDDSQQLNAFTYYKDRKGTEFVGTMNGLFYIKNGEIIRFTQNGLKIFNPIFFILQDRENSYWFGTNNGVYRWDGINDPEVINTFNGLAGHETNRSAGLLDSKGRVWVGTDRGLSCFTTSGGYVQAPPPSLDLKYIETTRGERFQLGKNNSLNYSLNTFSVHFRGISFVNEEMMTYRYKLAGYDKDWREATQSMLDKIRYIDIKPGKYRLCVCARNYSSAWSQPVYSAEIVIRNPFYLTWWFILGCAGLVTALLWIAYTLASQRLINKTLKTEISEREKAEESLKESKEHLSFVLEGSRLGTWDWDILHNRIERNNFWAEMLGYHIDEIEQTPQQWLELIHPDDKERSREGLQFHLDGITPLFEMDYRLRTKDNKYKWIHDRAMIVQRDAKGLPLRMSGTHTDITERKQAEDALQKSEERLRLLLSSLPVAIFVAPVNSDKDLDMITGNLKALTGFTEEEFLAKPDFWRSRLHPDDRQRVLDAFRKHAEAGSITIEYRWQMADGAYKWFHDQTILKDNGSQQEYLGVFVDINDRKLNEQEINTKNEQLNLINAEKDKLFSIISHDLRSPVNGFLSLSFLLSDEMERLTKEQIGEIARSLYSSAGKVNDLLNDLLEWSQLQRGLTVFEPAALNLKQVADECISFMDEQSKAKAIQVINEIPVGTEITADVHMLQVVLRNLLTNAVKFTPKGGRVLISVAAENDLFARISITDTGIGMSDDLSAKLFMVNEKTSRKGTEGEPSSGLGLILCKEFVEKQNGNIWVESVEGKGSTFSFTVPV